MGFLCYCNVKTKKKQSLCICNQFFVFLNKNVLNEKHVAVNLTKKSVKKINLSY